MIVLGQGAGVWRWSGGDGQGAGVEMVRVQVWRWSGCSCGDGQGAGVKMVRVQVWRWSGAGVEMVRVRVWRWSGCTVYHYLCSASSHQRGLLHGQPTPDNSWLLCFWVLCFLLCWLPCNNGASSVALILLDTIVPLYHSYFLFCHWQCTFVGLLFGMVAFFADLYFLLKYESLEYTASTKDKKNK